MRERFSKAWIADTIIARMERLKNQHRFKDGDGWAVVDGDDQARVLAFGQFDALRDVLDDIQDR